jgi:DNA-binding transcriptional LysR family regulator
MLSPVKRLQLRDFRLVHAIADTGQLALAAERIAITQPAASRMLAKIERLVGSPVFTRHPKGMTPTPVGELLARNAASLLHSVEQTLQETQAVIAGRAGTVRVGAVTGAAVGFVVPAIRELKRTAAGVDLHVDVASSDALTAGLSRGDYDFVLSRIPPGSDARQYSVLPGRVEQIQFLARNGHPLAGKGPLKPGDLAGHEWVIQARHTPLRQAVEEAFIAHGVPLPNETVNTTSLLLMMAYLVSTNAIAPVAREVVELIASGNARFVTLDLEEPIIINPYHLIALKGRVMSPIAMRLRDLILEALLDTKG